VRSLLADSATNVSRAVYGSVLVCSVVTVAAGDEELGLWRIATIVASTIVIYWLAHVYAATLGATIRTNERISVAAVRRVAANEWPLLQAAALPLLAIVLGALDVLARETALWIAVLIPIASLFAWGVVYARRERMSRLGTIAVASVTAFFGVVVVILKGLLYH
jgi:hypothetical protein